MIVIFVLIVVCIVAVIAIAGVAMVKESDEMLDKILGLRVDDEDPFDAI